MLSRMRIRRSWAGGVGASLAFGRVSPAAVRTGSTNRTLDVPNRPLWSPDGRGFFTGGPNGAPGIWVQPLDGGAPYKVDDLPPNSGGGELSADGKLVYVVGSSYADNVLIEDAE